MPPLIAIAAGLTLAVILGLINGFLITRTGINSFIITLATSSIFTGIMLIVTKADSFDSLPESFLTFSRQRTLGLALSPLFWIMIVAAIVLSLFYNRTSLGRQILATGANRRAAQMSGLNVPGIIVQTHVLSAFLAGVAGIMSAAHVGRCSADHRDGLDSRLLRGDRGRRHGDHRRLRSPSSGRSWAAS